MMIETIKFLNNLNIDGIKIHMLYLEEDSQITKMYRKNPFHILTKEEYIKVVAKQISVLKENIVIHRLTSGPDRKKLFKPEWLNHKFILLNEIDKYLEENNILQGSKKA